MFDFGILDMNWIDTALIRAGAIITTAKRRVPSRGVVPSQKRDKLPEWPKTSNLSIWTIKKKTVIAVSLFGHTESEYNLYFGLSLLFREFRRPFSPSSHYFCKTLKFLWATGSQIFRIFFYEEWICYFHCHDICSYYLIYQQPTVSRGYVMSFTYFRLRYYQPNTVHALPHLQIFCI